MIEPRHLDESLNTLRSEIAALHNGDDHARHRLEALMQDIERTLANPKSAGASENLGDRLKATILRFEASHPRLAAVMNDVAEKLINIGI
jgi:hypothetical protein